MSTSDQSAVVESFSSFGWVRLEVVGFEGEGSVLWKGVSRSPFRWGWVSGTREAEEEKFEWKLRVRRGNGVEKVWEGGVVELLEVEGLLEYNDRSVALEMRPRKG